MRETNTHIKIEVLRMRVLYKKSYLGNSDRDKNVLISYFQSFSVEIILQNEWSEKESNQKVAIWEKFQV